VGYLWRFQSHGCWLDLTIDFVNTDIYTRTDTHLYEHMYAHLIPMHTFEKLSRLDFEIHEVGHQKYFTVDRNVVFHWKNN
jgi:hypothetical protein